HHLRRSIGPGRFPAATSGRTFAPVPNPPDFPAPLDGRRPLLFPLPILRRRRQPGPHAPPLLPLLRRLHPPFSPPLPSPHLPRRPPHDLLPSLLPPLNPSSLPSLRFHAPNLELSFPNKLNASIIHHTV